MVVGRSAPLRTASAPPRLIIDRTTLIEIEITMRVFRASELDVLVIVQRLDSEHNASHRRFIIVNERTALHDVATAVGENHVARQRDHGRGFWAADLRIVK